MEKKPQIKMILHPNVNFSLESLRDSQDDTGFFDKQSILIIDEDYLTETLRTILLASNFKVEVARSGAQALRAVSQKSYNLVLLEEKLPDSTGIEIAQLIKNMSHETRIILMTRDENWRETLENVPEAVDFILLKPFPLERLISTIEKILPTKPVLRPSILLKPPLA